MRRAAFRVCIVYNGGMGKMADPAVRPESRYTYGDYRRWDDDERWEIIDGEAWNMSPAPSPGHQLLISQFVYRFMTHLGDAAKRAGCLVFPAPFDVVIPDYRDQDVDDARTVVQPDVSVLCDRGKLRPFGCVGGPDLAVEIISPWSAKRDLAEKHAVYERAGVREYWAVDPGNRFVHVFRLGQDGRYGKPDIVTEGKSITSSVLAGFTLPASELFAALV
jgi:Uma2 family endonuclease